METKTFYAEVGTGNKVIIFLMAVASLIGAGYLFLNGGTSNLIFSIILTGIALLLLYLLFVNQIKQSGFEFNDKRVSLISGDKRTSYSWYQVDSINLKQANGQLFIQFITTDETIKLPFINRVSSYFGGNLELISILTNNFKGVDFEVLLEEMATYMEANQRTTRTFMEVRDEQNKLMIIAKMLLYFLVSTFIYALSLILFKSNWIVIAFITSYLIKSVYYNEYQNPHVLTRIMIAVLCASQIPLGYVGGIFIIEGIQFDPILYLETSLYYIPFLLESLVENLFEIISLLICLNIGFSLKGLGGSKKLTSK